MNKDIEEIVVRTFFERRIQERVMFELFSPKKRDKALHRLNHDYKRNLREQYMIEIPTPNSCASELANLLKKHDAGKQCYALSFNKDIDGKNTFTYCFRTCSRLWISFSYCMYSKQTCLF
ncbi:hypothetical protein [Priestia aryabhattai]|uniref:hypothetical protein n=1 Tax=Priestia aryabhattai TaxID=412384 RepID=UPI00203D61D7|nr:hypothetical protein [Priestia aryabhattai]MCM3254928.1 hypothetical protein [Priestia aryabhattai]